MCDPSERLVVTQDATTWVGVDMMVRKVVLELGALFPSPEYWATTPTLPVPTPVKLTEQDPRARAQVAAENVTLPGPPSCVQETVPEGWYPTTFAVHLISVDEPTVTEGGVQETTVLEFCMKTAKSKAPDDGEL